jgi:hypothetical protein
MKKEGRFEIAFHLEERLMTAVSAKASAKASRLEAAL